MFLFLYYVDDAYRRHYVNFFFSFSEGGVPVEVHQALQAAMEKLQQRFTSLMQEKADLKERVEELEHRCIQLSGETDTIGVTLGYFVVDINWLENTSTGSIKFCVCLSRRVHRPVPESAGYHEAETPREGAVHQHVGPGQGGDEGTAEKLFY